MIEMIHLPPELRPTTGRGAEGAQPMSLDAIEKMAISEALRRNGGSRKRTAGELGIDVSTLFRKIRQLAIELPEKDGRGRRRQ